MRRYIYSLIILIQGLFLFNACMDDEFTKKQEVAEGLPAVVRISTVTPDVDIMTKSVSADSLKKIKDLFVFVFNAGSGNQLISKHYFQDGGTGSGTPDSPGALASSLNLNTTSGSRYIYAVANTKGANTEDVFDQLNVITDLAGLKALRIQLKSETYNFSGDIVLMSGAYHSTLENARADKELASEEVEIIAGEDNLLAKVYLKRAISTVNIEIAGITGTERANNFVLTSYQIVNIPKSSTLIGADLKDKSVFKSDVMGDMNVLPSATYKKYAFSFYMLENQNTLTGATSFYDREKRNPTGWDPLVDPSGEFVKAPKTSTYLVLKGVFSGKINTGPFWKPVYIDGRADVTYYVHLGYNGNKYDDFNIYRNTDYTYKIAIVDVDNIYLEVSNPQEDYPRGDGTIYTGAYMRIDAHFLSVGMQLQGGNEYEISYEGQGKDWVEIAPGCKPELTSWGDGYNVVTYQPNPYPINQQELMTSSKMLNDYLKDKAGPVYLTFHCKENYGTDADWKDYVNKPDRICRLRVKGSSTGINGKYVNGSTIIEGKAGDISIMQRSIKTFYGNNAQVGYGLETVMENSNIERYQFGSLKAAKIDFNEFWGNKNAVVEILNSSSLRSWSDVNDENCKSALFACMSRNRDENGDNEINENEIKWSLPSAKQLAGLSLGAKGLQDARLFRYDPVEGTRIEGVMDWVREGTWGVWNPRFEAGTASSGGGNRDVIQYFYSFWTNTGSPSDKYRFYSEEAGTMGLHITEGGKPGAVRCVRNLGAVSKATASDDGSFYQYSNYVFDLSRMRSDVLRSSFYDKELPKHSEISEDGKLPQKFEVARADVGDGYDWIGVNNAIDKGDAGPCAAYEQGSDKKGWRLPNQQELLVMLLEKNSGTNDILTKGKNYMCRTYFSNQQYRAGFATDGNNMKTFDAGQDRTMSVNEHSYTVPGFNQRKFSIRCVRDVR